MSTTPERTPFPAAGERIEALIKARGLDVTKLARLAAINPSTARDAIAGRNVTVGTVLEIARALGVRVEKIWSLTQEGRPRRADAGRKRARNARSTASVEGA